MSKTKMNLHSIADDEILRSEYLIALPLADRIGIVNFIKSKGFILLDLGVFIKNNKNNKSNTIVWKDLNKQSPVLEIDVDHAYLFVPIPMENQSFKDAYIANPREYPAIQIINQESKRWRSLDVHKKDGIDGHVGTFTKMIMSFDDGYTVFMTANYDLGTDLVIVPFEHLGDVIREHFNTIESFKIKS